MILLENKKVEESHYIEPRLVSDMIGAYWAMSGIKDSFTLLHGTIGCGWYSRCIQTYDCYDESEWMCTGLAEADIVYGGEERLGIAIKRAAKVFKPSMICVVGGTVSTLIGDDMDGVVNAMRTEFAEEGIDIPLISVPTSVLEGDKILGLNLVAEALVDKVVGKPAQKRSNTVNIFGVLADRPNAKADVAEMKRLLGELGIQVQAVFCAATDVDSIRHASEANLNLVVSEVVGVEAARKMEKRFGLPILSTPSPVGITNTKRFLQAAADFFGIEKKLVDELIARETEVVYSAMRRASFGLVDMRSFGLLGSTAAVSGDSSHVFGVARWLVEEWGIKPVLLVLKTYNEASLEMVAELEKELGLEFKVLLKPTREQIRQALAEIKPKVILGGNHEKFEAREAGLIKDGSVFVHIGTYPTAIDTDGRVDVFPHPYVGFQGAIWLCELLANEQINATWHWVWSSFPGPTSAFEIERRAKGKK